MYGHRDNTRGVGVEMERGIGRDVEGERARGDGREGEMEIWRDG